ncbi:MAG: ABC transporter ATP-binding protein [Ruminococcaceae bacterium]|nr:ABC transporter ATP-binding protein [Oscillospiraceae bacterium]
MIEIKNVTKNFDDFTALKEADIFIEKGTVYGLVGPNGSGKTTLIKCLCGVYRTNAGTITVDGEPVYDNPSLKERIAYIPDDLYFPATYTPRDMAKFYSTMYPSFSWEKYEKLGKLFQLDEKKRIARFSKGMQKQVIFWVCMSCCPDVIVLDEPVDGLDPVMRKKVWSVILQEVEERQVTVLISSHNLRELEDVCDHVGILHQGEVLLQKALSDMKSDTFKLQVAFNGDFPQVLSEKLSVLNHTQTGRVHLLIIRGSREDILQQVEAYEPVLADLIPLTLEEVFIYELGGKGYDFKNILD